MCNCQKKDFDLLLMPGAKVYYAGFGERAWTDERQGKQGALPAVHHEYTLVEL